MFIRTGTTWTQQQKLLAPDATCHHFGCSVALDDDTAIIGAERSDYYGDESGSAYIFTRTGTTWTQQARLLASDSAEGEYFGHSVSLDGDTALIGAIGIFLVGPGSAYVFTRTGSIWTQQQKLLGSDAALGDDFGWSVSLEGDTALIGAHIEDDWNGSAYMFTRTGTTWTEQQKLHSSNGITFGSSVALDGRTALIGASEDDDNGYSSGSVYVFIKEGVLPLEINITGGLGVTAIITNNDATNVNDIKWQIHAKGGILGFINKSVNGSIDIPGRESIIISTGLIVGIGRLTITIKVAEEEKAVKGIQLFIFSMVKD
jgi:hypothetical protein